MATFTWLLHLTAMLLFVVRIGEAACIPEDSPQPPNRDALARLLPAEGGSDFLPRFHAALRASTKPEAGELLENLTDAKRDASFHRQQVRGYLDACQARASAPEAATEWFGLRALVRCIVSRPPRKPPPRV